MDITAVAEEKDRKKEVTQITNNLTRITTMQTKYKKLIHRIKVNNAYLKYEEIAL